MIASLHGTVAHAGSDSVVLEVAGVGYLVAVLPEVARSAHAGTELRLHTSMLVREDAVSLVGFADRAELEVFGALLAVSGVGPKSALGVLAGLSIDQIVAAVAAEDDAPFRKVSGIGPKTAKLIVVQLAGKLAPRTAFDQTPVTGARAGGDAALRAAVTEALVGLGWNERTAAEAAEHAVANAPDERAIPALLRSALQTLGPARTERIRG